LTYVFELIHPENRIVLDYGDRRGLVLLAVIETGTGRERNIYGPDFEAFNRVDRLDPSALEDIARLGDDRLVEGVVANFAGHRVKIKTDEYVRLHRIVTNFTPKRVWEALSGGDSLEFENMPEEFQAWLDDTIKGFRDEFDAIRNEIDIEFERASTLTDKELGLSDGYRYRSQIFMLRRGKDVEPAIWKLIRDCPRVDESKKYEEVNA
jgi:RNA ligase